MKAVVDMRIGQEKALASGVRITQKSFWSKALGPAFAALGLAAAVGAVAASGGTVLVAAAAIAGVVCALSVADACCAYMTHKNTQAYKAGASVMELPYPGIQMGSSSLANVLFMACKSAHASDEKAAKISRWIDNTVRIGLGLAAGLCTFGVQAAANSLQYAAPLVVAAATTVKGVIDLTMNRAAAKVYAEGNDEMHTRLDALEKMALNTPGLTDAQRTEYAIMVGAIRSEANEEVRAIETVLPQTPLDTTWAPAGHAVAAGVAVTAAVALHLDVSPVIHFFARMFEGLAPASLKGGGAGGIVQPEMVPGTLGLVKV